MSEALKKGVAANYMGALPAVVRGHHGHCGHCAHCGDRLGNRLRPKGFL
jgi:hypothetical protein